MSSVTTKPPRKKTASDSTPSKTQIVAVKGQFHAPRFFGHSAVAAILHGLRSETAFLTELSHLPGAFAVPGLAVPR